MFNRTMAQPHLNQNTSWTKPITTLIEMGNNPVDIKILWCIHNCPIVYDKIFVIKLISNWWRGRLANEIKPSSNIQWRKPHGSIKRKTYMEMKYQIKFIIQLSINAERKFQIKYYWIAYK